jgi:hypothetical protein
MSAIPEENAGSSALADFPESWFAPAPDREEPYQALVDRGRSIMRDKRVVICGLARDVAETLPETIARIECLGRMFADYRVVIYENDSTDATREMLDDWEKTDPRVVILSECRGDPANPPVRCLQRARRMAFYRNQYREFVAASYADFDHVIVVDMDLHVGWSYEGVANTFGHPDWDFVGSYGIIRRSYLRQTLLVHYDAWAFRKEGSYLRLSTKEVNHMSWQRGDPMLEVASCFGGLGIYRIEAMLACEYDGSDCEHVAFHRSMRDTGLDRLYLNPSQITFYGKKANNLVRACHRIGGVFGRRAA